MDRLLPLSASLEIWENGYFVLIPLLFQDFHNSATFAA